MVSSLMLLVLLGVASHSCGSLVNLCSKNKDSVREPLLAAVLDLHFGEHCDEPNIASFQQLAVLDYTVKQMNEGSKGNIGFQVFDSCSTEQGALSASMQAFVASQQTCLYSPLFTGFLGPENTKFLKAVKNFTNSFNFTHILSYLPDDMLTMERVVYVSKYPVASFAQAIESVVEKLDLRSPVILFEDNSLPRLISDLLKKVKPEPEICAHRISYSVSSTAQLEQLIQFGSVHDGIIVIVESEEMLKSVSKILDSESVEDPVILVDLKNSAVENDYSWNHNVLIVNQISSFGPQESVSSVTMSVKNAVHSFVTDSSHICSKYKLTSCSDDLLTKIMEDDYNWSLQLYRTVIQLLMSAVKSAVKLKCSSDRPCLSTSVISQNEWHAVLNSSSAVISPKESPVSFRMNVPASYIVKATSGSEGLKKVCQLEDGRVNCISAEHLPSRMKNISCPTMVESVTVETTVQSNQLDFLDSWLNPENAKLLGAVGMVCGAVVGILLMMLILTACVYRNFKPESSRPRSPSSHTTMSRAGSFSS